MLKLDKPSKLTENFMNQYSSYLSIAKMQYFGYIIHQNGL